MNSSLSFNPANLALAAEYVKINDIHNERLGDALIEQLVRMDIQAEGLSANMLPERHASADEESDDEDQMGSTTTSEYIPTEAETKLAAQRLLELTSSRSRVINYALGAYKYLIKAVDKFYVSMSIQGFIVWLNYKEGFETLSLSRPKLLPDVTNSKTINAAKEIASTAAAMIRRAYLEVEVVVITHITDNI